MVLGALLLALAALLLIPGTSDAQTPANQAATGKPRVLVSADGVGFLYADTSEIADGNGLQYLKADGSDGSADSGDGAPYHSFSYQWLRVDGGTETSIGGDSSLYQVAEADYGKQIKVRVSFEDEDGYDESVTSEPFGPVLRGARSGLAQSTLVSNTGQPVGTTTTFSSGGRYTMAFRLGAHGQGYEISSVSIDLAAVPSSLTVSLYIAGIPGLTHADSRRYKLFDFANPSSFKVGLNRFTAPGGAFVYQNVNHYIVLSGFSSLSVRETSSNAEDAGGETGAVLSDDASSDGDGALRMLVEGARRERGFLAANYTQPFYNNQEIISVGDKYGWRMSVGSADRYLVRGFSIYGDDTTARGGGFTNPYNLQDGSTTLFQLHNSRDVAGISVWTAPRGATVPGSDVYDFVHDGIGGSNQYRWDAVLLRIWAQGREEVRNAMNVVTTEAVLPAEDTPPAAGVTLSLEPGGDVDIPHGADGAPYMAVIGLPLDAMMQNVGKTAASDPHAVTNTDSVVSQGFTTGSNAFGYQLQGIGVEIEGSGSKFPDGPTSVSVAVHAADASGRPGGKLFDLISPDEFAAGHSFFEAPPGAWLEPNKSYAMVWTHLGGTEHRLAKTADDGEDSGAAAGAGIADAFHLGSDVNNLSVSGLGSALQIAVYTLTLDSLDSVERPFVQGGHPVSENWFHLPEGVGVGDQFRLLFVTHHDIDAMSGDIKVYNDLVQFEAAGRSKRYPDTEALAHPIIRQIHSQFKAVVCTSAVDARDNTGMTDGIGVPIHWLDGGWEDRPTLIANTYAQFFGGEWTNADEGAYVFGNTMHFDKNEYMWTGCTSTGIAHADYPMGTTPMVIVGTPKDGERHPLGSVGSSGYKTDNSNKLKGIYGISPVFTVVD